MDLVYDFSSSQYVPQELHAPGTRAWCDEPLRGMNGSREHPQVRRKWNVEEISAEIVDTAFKLHRGLGPGLLESVYEVVLAKQLERRGLAVERQKDVAIVYDGLAFDLGFRADLLVEGKVLVELKSVETLASVHGKQVLTYLRLLNLSLGLLINFGAASFKEGVKRIVNQHSDFASSREEISLSRTTFAQEMAIRDERITG